MGVVTGIVQEFQFGMNWSEYSRFVGDVFGAPLALEGLLAFFFEATFIGLWIFGWDKLPRGLHLATIWATAIGSIALGVLHHRGERVHAEPGRLRDERREGPRRARRHLGAAHESRSRSRPSRTRSPRASWSRPASSSAPPAWHLARNQHLDTMRPALKFGLWMMVGAGILTTLFGDQLSLAMVATQPMKMAAAEAMYDTVCGADASFSLFTLGTPDGSSELFSIRVPVPALVPLDAHLRRLRRGHQRPAGAVHELYGPGDYTPIIWVTYWSFRWMIGLGLLHVLVAVVGLWLTRKGRHAEAGAGSGRSRSGASRSRSPR